MTDDSPTNEVADDAVLGGLNARLLPLRTLEPAGSYADLEPLRDFLRGVTIVGLGESTHGVHEFFTVKHRLVEFLVVELGFTVFALEASYAACVPINDYVLHGTGEPAAVLSGQRYLAWDSEEFGALVAWLRTYNDGVADDAKVSFYGLDVGFNEVGRAQVSDYLSRLAPDHLADIEPTFAALREQENRWPLATDPGVSARASSHSAASSMFSSGSRPGSATAPRPRSLTGSGGSSTS